MKDLDMSLSTDLNESCVSTRKGAFLHPANIACYGRFVGFKKDGSEVDELFADIDSFVDGKIRTRRSYLRVIQE